MAGKPSVSPPCIKKGEEENKDMKKLNNKGIIPISLYIGLGALVLLVIAGSIIWGQHQKVLRLEEKNKTLTADNRILGDNAIKQRNVDAEEIKTLNTKFRECINNKCPQQCIVIQSACPEVKIISDYSKDGNLKELDGLFRRSQ